MVTSDAKLQHRGNPPPQVGQPYQAARSARQGQPPQGRSKPSHTAAACSYPCQRPINTARFSHSRLGLANQDPGFVPVERRVSASRSTRRRPSKQQQRKENKNKRASGEDTAVAMWRQLRPSPRRLEPRPAGRAVGSRVRPGCLIFFSTATVHPSVSAT